MLCLKGFRETVEKFDEGQHPRGEDGRFTHSGGGKTAGIAGGSGHIGHAELAAAKIRQHADLQNSSHDSVDGMIDAAKAGQHATLHPYLMNPNSSEMGRWKNPLPTGPTNRTDPRAPEGKDTPQTRSWDESAMNKVSPTTENITGLMTEAKAAHTKYEKETGKPDEDWAGWYAGYVTDRLDHPTTKDAMKEMITAASKIHTGDDWPAKYAEHITSAFAKAHTTETRSQDGSAPPTYKPAIVGRGRKVEGLHRANAFYADHAAHQTEQRTRQHLPLSLKPARKIEGL